MKRPKGGILRYLLLLSLVVLEEPSVPSWIFSQPSDVTGTAILVHPDGGVPKMAHGIVKVTWDDFGLQLARRLQWDLPTSSVQVMKLSKFCQALERPGVKIEKPNFLRANPWPF